jgi:hypothetical protein
MSVWKKLNKQDAFVTTYVAKKKWTISGADLESAGVKFLPAYSSFTVNETTSSIADCNLDLSGSYEGETCLIELSGSFIDICDLILSGSVVII